MGAKYVKAPSPTSFNNTIGVLRTILQIGVERGIRYSNPAAGLKRARLRKREFKLPSQNQFHALVQEIRHVPYGPGSRPVKGPEQGEVIELPARGELHHRYSRRAA